MQLDIASFGKVIDGKIIAGYYCKEHWQEQTPVTMWKKVRYRRPSKRSGYRLVPYLYEYDRSRMSWLPILPSSTEHLSYRMDITCDLSFCSVRNSILVRLSINKGGEYGLGEEYDYKIACFQFIIGKEKNEESRDDIDVSEITFSMKYLNPSSQGENTECRLEMNETDQIDRGFKESDWTFDLQKRDIDYTFRESCLVESKSNLVMLFGYQESSNEQTQHRICKAMLDVDGFKIECNNIETYTTEDVIRKPISFKLKDNVYVMETLRGIPNSGTFHLKCVKYNIVEKVYHTSCYLLPSLLKSIHAVVTDSEEEFAIILGLIEVDTDSEMDEIDTSDINGRFQVHKPRLLIFSEQNGFEQKLKHIDLSQLTISAGIGFASSGSTLLRINF